MDLCEEISFLNVFGVARTSFSRVELAVACAGLMKLLTGKLDMQLNQHIQASHLLFTVHASVESAPGH